MPLHVKFQSVNFNFGNHQVSVEPGSGSHVLLLMFMNEKNKGFMKNNVLPPFCVLRYKIRVRVFLIWFLIDLWTQTGCNFQLSLMTCPAC